MQLVGVDESDKERKLRLFSKRRESMRSRTTITETMIQRCSADATRYGGVARDTFEALLFQILSGAAQELFDFPLPKAISLKVGIFSICS